MSNLLERGAQMFRDKLPQAASQTVELRTPLGVIEQLSAVPGRRDFAQYTVGDASGTDEVFDWIVAEQDLVIGGQKREPESDWEIRWRRPDGRLAIYEVLPGTGTRCFDVVDQYGILYRVHTKLSRVE